MRTDDAIKSAVQQWISANRSEATARDLTNLYATSATVGACADFRADMVSQVPMKIQRRKETVEDDHPFARMFGGGYSFPNLMRRSELAMSFWGRNLLHKRRNAFNIPVKLDWVNPNIYSNDLLFTDRGLKGFRIYASSMYHIEPISYLKAEDAIYMHGVDFDDDYDGIGEVERAFLEASIEPEKAQTQLAVFRNMAFLGGVAQPTGDKDSNSTINKDDKDNLVNFLARKVKGAIGAGTFLVSPKRWEFLTLQSPLKDLMLKEVAEDVRLSVCVAFRMPLELIVPSAANYAQFEGARRTWGHAWLVPRVEWYASVFTEQLAHEFGDEWRVVPDFDSVPFLKEDSASRATAVSSKVSSTLISLYDAQLELGDEPDDELKDLYIVQGIPVPKTELGSLWKTHFAPAPPAFGGMSADSIPDGEKAIGDDADSPQSEPVNDHAAQSLCIMLDLANHPDLIGLQARVKELQAHPGVEWNNPAEFHVTVLYAPVVTTEQAVAVQAALAEIDVPALTLGVGSLNTFDNLGNYALHFRVKQNADLIDFQESVYDLCIAAGVPVSLYSNPASYKPHITIGYAAVKPRNVTFSSKIVVQPISLFMTVGAGDNVVWRSEAGEAEVAPTLLEAPIPDDQFKDLKSWEALTARKGADYPFKSTTLPQVVRDYLQVALADGEGVQAFADVRTWLRRDAPALKAYADTQAGFVAEMVRIISAAQADESSRRQFSGAMNSATRRFGLSAFRDGMKAEGVDPESFDAQQLSDFRAWQSETSTYITAFGNELFKQGGITEAEIKVRAQEWANKSLRDVYYRGAALVGADNLKRWKLGNAEHCSTCLSLADEVRTLKAWSASILPGSDKLECRGFNCACSLVDAQTDHVAA